ncbi:MAG: hypothetical protein RR702_06775 [Clostridia bacterium]
MKKICLVMCMCLAMSATPVLAAEPGANAFDNQFNFLEDLKDTAKDAYSKAKDYYYEKDIPGKAAGTFEKTKEVFKDTADSVKENFPEESKAVTDVKDKTVDKFNEVKDEVKNEKAEFDEANPDKVIQEEEIKDSAKVAGSKIGDFFRKIRIYIFGE